MKRRKTWWTPKRRKQFPEKFREHKHRSDISKRGWETRREHHGERAHGLSLCKLSDRLKLADKITDDFNTGERLKGMTREQTQKVRVFFNTGDDLRVHRFDISAFKKFLRDQKYSSIWKPGRLCKEYKSIEMAPETDKGSKGETIYRYTRRIKQRKRK